MRIFSITLLKRTPTLTTTTKAQFCLVIMIVENYLYNHNNNYLATRPLSPFSVALTLKGGNSILRIQ